jgi:hypothetical protein
MTLLTELGGTTRTITMSIGHFSWCIVAAVFVGTCVGMFALALVHSRRHGDDE